MELIEIIDIVCDEYNSRYLPPKYSEPKYNLFLSFSLKHMSMINRMLYLNRIVIPTQHKYWQETINSPKFDNSTPEKFMQSNIAHREWEHKLTYSLFQQEELIMHLRKLIDDCIALYCVAKQKFNDTGTPLESIGELINQIDKFSEFKAHLDYLKTVNNLSNSLKHSAVNPIYIRIGQNEPCVFTVSSKKDKNKNIIYNDMGISINDLIRNFNSCYKTFDAYLKE
ncbi:MAG: hypothetical protein K2O89_00280 [Clostridia bacterium]|nr:hypothetical protein [Clostridia bacterium]